MPPQRDDVTRMLHSLAAGDSAVREGLYATVYDELRAIARSALRRESGEHTLSTTDLVHDAYVRLVDIDRVSWQDRAHFFAVAARVMRRVLVDWARARRAQKRGGAQRALSLDDVGMVPAPGRAEPLLALDEALDRLALRSERQARVVECRYFAGLTIEETAEALGVSPTTVKQDWTLARTWLFREMSQTPG